MTQTNISVIVAHDDGVEGPWVTQHITRGDDIVVEHVLGSLSPGLG